jgi:hypothetical protein
MVINLIKNPSFELGITNWIFFTGSQGSFTISTPGFDDSNAAKIAINIANSNIQLYQTGLILEPFTNYKFSFSGYSNNDRNIYASIIKHTTPFTVYGLNILNIDLTTAWKSFTYNFTTPNITTMNDGRLMFQMGTYAMAGDIYYIDNIILEKIIPCPSLSVSLTL